MLGERDGREGRKEGGKEGRRKGRKKISLFTAGENKRMLGERE